MVKISHINPEDARFNPASEFETPRKLVEATGLTRGQKLAALERWAFEIERHLAASDEGMPSNSRAQKDLKVLDAIIEAQRLLQQTAD